MKFNLIGSAARAAQKICAFDDCRNIRSAVLITALLPEVSQERVEKVAGMVVTRVAIRDLMGARLHYATNGFEAEQVNFVRPLLQ